MPVVRFSNPLRAVFARQLGLPDQDFAVGAELEVDAEDASKLLEIGYAVLVGGTAPVPPPVQRYMTEAAIVAELGDRTKPIGAAGRTAYVPRWQASTAYLANDIVLNPSGQNVQAKADHTSGTSFNASNWNVVAGAVASVAGQTGAVTGAQIAADAAFPAAFARAEVPSSLPSGTLLAHRYDPLRQAYNVTPDTLRKWFGALARTKTSGGAPARVTCVGHSYVVGTSTSPRHAGSFATKLRDLFNAKYGSAGTGIVYLVTTALSDESRIVVTGTWAAALGTRGAFNAACYNATGTGNTIAFTPDIPVDSFKVYYVRNAASGTFTVNVDGGTAQNVNGNKSAPEDIPVATISAGSLGTHTLNIVAPASGQCYIAAVEGVVGTQGVRVSRVGRSGATVSTVTTAGSGPAVDSLGTIFNSAPDLTVIMCEVNDYLTAVPVATFTANLTTLVNRAKLTGDVLVLVDPNVKDQPNATSGLNQSAYHAAIYGLADSLNFGVLDIAARWKDYTTAVADLPGLMASAAVDATGVHPYYIGHQDIANAVFAVIG